MTAATVPIRRRPAELVRQARAAGLSIVALARKADVSGDPLYTNRPIGPEEFSRLEDVIREASSR